MSFSGSFFAGWVIDGSGGAIQERVLLTIVDGVLLSMEKCELSDVQDDCVDFSHCTIMPPLVDSHIHLWMSGTTDLRKREQQLVAGYDELRPVITKHLQCLLNHGVLAVREGGHRSGASLRYREEAPEANNSPIITRMAGRAWHRKGRYGALIGRAPEGNTPLASAYMQESEMGDHIKLVNSGLNSLKEFGRQTASQFSLEEIGDLVEVANTRHQKIMVHANGEEPVRLALEAGCHSIEHGYFMGDDNLKRLAEKGATWVPTIYTMKAYAEHMEEGPGGSREVAKKNYLHQLQQLSMARELGVRVALGTDAGSMGVFHGESVVEELKLFMAAGYSLSEAMGCATYNGASLLEIEEMGLLQPKRPASFIVVRATPSQLPGKLSCLEAIFVDGCPCPGFTQPLSSPQ